ncbi:serine hydrolase [Nonomuraea typhae]|uniref:serine hydrolase n=1 Tax=Nonomuraea typhae TaxID=2603600 RepID=UPI0012FCA6FD|nr:serine hydrolase [Nonomuraea typhae]
MRVRGISLIAALAVTVSACADVAAGMSRAVPGPGSAVPAVADVALQAGAGYEPPMGTVLVLSLEPAIPREAVASDEAVREPLPEERRQRLDRTLKRYLGERPGRASVAVYDRSTGTRYVYPDREPFLLASVAKVDILLALVLKTQDAGRRLTKDERQLAAKMIRYSDNDCAHELYQAVGGVQGMTGVLRRLRIRHTWPRSSWGTTLSRPADQVKVLDRLTDPDGPVNAANRRFVLGLMSTVTRDQAWGVSAAAGDGQVALKNGWLPAGAHGGLWTINSVGRLQTGGHDFLLAVLSERSPAMGTGVETVEDVARVVVKALSREEAPAAALIKAAAPVNRAPAYR